MCSCLPWSLLKSLCECTETCFVWLAQYMYIVSFVDPTQCLGECIDSGVVEKKTYTFFAL